MTPEQLLEWILPAWRAALPRRRVARLDRFLRRYRPAVLEVLQEHLERQAPPAEPTVHRVEWGVHDTAPPDEWTPAKRTRANLEAMRLVASRAPGDFTESERRAVLAYSGWGGLSIEENEKKFPPGMAPETFGLIHEYYTPSVVAEAIAERVCPLLPELAGNDGLVRCLEPSVGIGRLARALSRCEPPPRQTWTTVEFSAISSQMWRAVRPDAAHFHMPFERWIAKHAAEHAGTVNLILSNPPYGERGQFAAEDPDPKYKEKHAYAYFLRRALELLVPRGLGVFLVPAACMSGTSATSRTLRQRLLLRNHLAAAYRLPSETTAGKNFVPGASVVMDVLFWRARGGQLAAVGPADAYILEGRYFELHPEHVLGTESGAFADQKGRRRYEVVGDFTGLPTLEERPFCVACQLRPVRGVPRAPGVPAEPDVSPDLQAALQLGERVGRYLVLRSQDEHGALLQLWPELVQALHDLKRSPPVERVGGNPWRWQALRELAEKTRVVAAQHLLNAFEPTDGGLLPAIGEPPDLTPKFEGRPDDVVGQATELFKQQRGLTLDQIHDFHRARGGSLDRAGILAALLAADWCLDGPQWDDLLPRDSYLSGKDLWERHDRASLRATQGDAQAARQVRLLIDAIKPLAFEELPEISARHGYVPLPLVGQWLGDTLNKKWGPTVLERKEGLLVLAGRDPETLRRKQDAGESVAVTPATMAFIGYANHDPELFRPPRDETSKKDAPQTREERAQEKLSLAEKRLRLAKEWDESFAVWCRADDARKQALADAYNRANRGRIVPTYSTEPLEIARWNPRIKLHAHQAAGARRVLDNRGGLIAFDVGVGKTFTAIAILARARQEGWVRRPVILVPSSLVWKWHDDIRCALPDYRVLVIGSNRKHIRSGKRIGVLTSETDTADERARKWTAFQAGLVDVAVLSYDSLGQTELTEAAVVDYVDHVSAIQRSLALRRRNAKARSKGDLEKLSERERALIEHGTAAWVREILKPNPKRPFDPGIRWDELGIDLLIVDEAQNFKNLYKPQAREDGFPKFMGGGEGDTKRAWQLDFRAAIVRRNTGGSGVVLLSATPAKNSPLEFYNVIQYIDPGAFYSAGIQDPEQFIDRFIKIERRDVLDTSFSVVERSAVTGFQNLEDLRTIVSTYGEFRTAEEVGLRLPTPIIEQVKVTMDYVQDAKYARYVSEIEDLLERPGTGGNRILGLFARLSLIAMHPDLEEGYDWDTALEGGLVRRKIPSEALDYWLAAGWTLAPHERRVRDLVEKAPSSGDDEDEVEEFVHVQKILPRPASYSSPKFEACAKRVAATRGCGHIIFCEQTAPHQWIREVLVEHGVPRERIAVLNAIVTKPADRTRIAREFNGLSSEPLPAGSCGGGQDIQIEPKFDVVIANSVAYEGIDLQVRTCMIHHIDLPWTPADLQQRNGRGVRQGNVQQVVNVNGSPAIGIYYYFADESADGYRFNLIDGKATWLADLLKSQVRDTNNPAAQQELSPEDILIMISRNKEKTRALLEKKRQERAEAARKKVGAEASRLLRSASSRFAAARATRDGERAAKLRAEGELYLADLEAIDPALWPWQRWVSAVRDHEVVHDTAGAPLWDGLRITRPRFGSPDQIEHVEFGRVLHEDTGTRIGVRAEGSPVWMQFSMAQELRLQPGNYPRADSPPWPASDEHNTERAIARHLSQLQVNHTWESLGWRGASEEFLRRWWPRFGAEIADWLSTTFSDEHFPTVLDGLLVLGQRGVLTQGTIVPPTEAGWHEYLRLAPASHLTFTQLKELGWFWWQRQIPSTLLAASVERFARGVVAPRVATTAAVVNALANAPETAREEADKALDRVMQFLAGEDEGYADLHRRYTSEPGFREHLAELSFASITMPTAEAAAEQRQAEAAKRLHALDLPDDRRAYFRRRLARAVADVADPTRVDAVLHDAAARKPVPPPAPAEDADAIITRVFNEDAAFQVAWPGRDGVYLVRAAGGRDPVAALKITDDYEIKDLRSLRPLASRDETRIRRQMERALRAAYAAQIAADPGFDLDETASPLDEKINAMKAHAESLDAVPARVLQSESGAYNPIRPILIELADPAVTWGEVAELVEDTSRGFDRYQYAAANPTFGLDFMQGIAEVILTAVRPTPLAAGDDRNFVVPADYVHDRLGNTGELVTCIIDSSGLELHPADLASASGTQTPGLRRFPHDVEVVAVKTRPWDAGRYEVTEKKRGRLRPGLFLLPSERSASTYAEVFDQLTKLFAELQRAPPHFADIRRLLYWSAATVDAERCQAATKRSALAAIMGAVELYRVARERLLDGATLADVQRMAVALRRVAVSAAEIAESCGEGQISLVPATLAVLPEDRAAIHGG